MNDNQCFRPWERKRFYQKKWITLLKLNLEWSNTVFPNLFYCFHDKTSVVIRQCLASTMIIFDLLCVCKQVSMIHKVFVPDLFEGCQEEPSWAIFKKLKFSCILLTDTKEETNQASRLVKIWKQSNESLTQLNTTIHEYSSRLLLLRLVAKVH